jgi:proline-specific peptidase
MPPAGERRTLQRIPRPPAAASPRRLTPYRDRHGFVDVQGEALFYRSLGDRRDPTVLVVHGGPSDHRYLSVLADLVPRGFRVIWFDQLGCGRSSRPASYRDFSMEGAGRQVEDVRRRLSLGRPHLFGHSWGGALALQAAVLFPRSFRSLAVCGGFASERSFEHAMREHTHRLPRSLREPIERSERAGRYDDPTYRTAVRRRHREYSNGLRVLPYEFVETEPAINRPLLRAIYGQRPGLLSPSTGALRSWDLRPKLGRIRIPTLIMSGEIEAGRYTARDLHRWLPQSRLVTFAGAAHLPFFQARDLFMESLLDFYGPLGPSGNGSRVKVAAERTVPRGIASHPPSNR